MKELSKLPVLLIYLFSSSLLQSKQSCFFTKSLDRMFKVFLKLMLIFLEILSLNMGINFILLKKA